MGQNVTTAAQDNINVIRKFWKALHHPGPASLQTMTELMDENIDWDVVPLDMKRRGRDEMRQLIKGPGRTGLRGAGTKSRMCSPVKSGYVLSGQLATRFQKRAVRLQKR